jgi:hypothetical protein
MMIGQTAMTIEVVIRTLLGILAGAALIATLVLWRDLGSRRSRSEDAKVERLSAAPTNQG